MRKAFLSFLTATSLALGVPGGCARADDVVLDSDGWQLHGMWQPVGGQAPAVLLLHDAAGDRSDFAAVADALVAAGVHALRLELRGHGASTNLGRFQPPYSGNLHINEEAWHDIVVAIEWLRAQPMARRVGVVGASYSGEQAARALREGNTRADAYVMFSPGSFQDESMAAAAASGVPWLFLRTEEESPASLRWIDEIYAALPELAPGAEVRVYPGSGHAAKMLEGRPELPAEIAEWLASALTLSESARRRPGAGTGTGFPRP
ncbi:MAG: dienelactone hydrolase family protein [Gammaproteobacteria bacterium]|nr:dienelactone hydrolase family protein [Gammaproteobacteria bacterium]MDH5344226.1 dienelactone hydrolase family protein [Gammaproteobacteria bacterium]